LYFPTLRSQDDNGVITEGKRKDKSVIDKKKTRTTLQTRVGMDFDSKPSILTSQDEVSKYLIRYHGRQPSLINVEFCPSGIDVKEAPPAEGVYLHPKY